MVNGTYGAYNAPMWKSRPTWILLTLAIAGFAKADDATRLCRFTLLTDTEVRKEFALSQPVEKKIDAILAKQQAEVMALVRSRRKGNRSTAALVSAGARLSDENIRMMALLTPSQKLRLEQLSFQYSGVNELEDPIVAKMVGLSREQVSKLNEADKQQLTQMLTPAKDPKLRSAQLVIRGAARNMNMKLFAQSVLTPSQWKTWLRMQGRPFHFSNRSL